MCKWSVCGFTSLNHYNNSCEQVVGFSFSEILLATRPCCGNNNEFVASTAHLYKTTAILIC